MLSDFYRQDACATLKLTILSDFTGRIPVLHKNLKSTIPYKFTGRMPVLQLENHCAFVENEQKWFLRRFHQ